MARTLVELFCWWALFSAVAVIATPGITPPGNVCTPLHAVAAGGMAYGAYSSAKSCRHPLVFLIYGLFCGLAFLPLCSPDNRDLLQIAGSTRSEERRVG